MMSSFEWAKVAGCGMLVPDREAAMVARQLRVVVVLGKRTTHKTGVSGALGCVALMLFPIGGVCTVAYHLLV